MEAAERQLVEAQQALIDALDGAAPVPAARAELAAARAAQEAAAADLALSFPDYAAFADPRPVDLNRIAALLGPGEVLVLYATSDMGGLGGSSPSQAFAVTRDRVLTADLPPRSEIEPVVRALRCAAALTDRRCGATGASSGEGGMRGAFSLQESEAVPRYEGFDTDLAHRAYQMLLAPLAPAMEGKTTLIVVPDKALAGLPFQILTTAPTAPGAPPAAVPWLIRDMAVTVSPSVASLVALRELPAHPLTDSLPFLGIGDPLIGAQVAGALPFDCATTSAAGLQASALAPATGSVLRAANGTDMGVETLAALPDTRCELEATAAYFGPGSALRLGAEATEGDLRRLSETGELARYRVISFATHGLVAGEIGANPAGLVLTPAPGAGAGDDGLLTTEEIAALQLDAEFVLLSACNTAAATREGEDGLSGLASAFFLAGARTLLVSHWPVYSDAATDLTTGLFEAMAADPGIGRAEALRRAMLDILEDPQATPRQRHPAYWAPFALAGQG
jgi:CHAT domain-containing protein